MTIMSAKRLDYFGLAMKQKGRLQVDAGADITIFNSKTIIDKATYTAPAQYSAGIEYVFVNGTPLIWQGRMDKQIYPGRAVRAGVH